MRGPPTRQEQQHVEYMANKQELIEAIKEKGYEVPAHVATNAQLKQFLDAVESGYTKEDMNEMFPPPAAPPLTPEAVAEMIAKALAKDRKERPAMDGQVINVSQKPSKPVRWNSRNADPEDFLPEGFRVFHADNGHSFDKFQVDGRLVPCPFSQIILFDTYRGPETQGFGLAENLAHMCMYTTYSKTERDLFLKDARWGTEFWGNQDKVVSDELELSMIATNIAKQLDHTPQADLKAMCIDRGIPHGDLNTMRASIALFDAKATQKQRKIDLAGRSIAMEREGLLVGQHGA